MADRDVIKALSASRITTSSTSYQDALTATGTPTNGSKDFWVLCSAILDKASTSSDVSAKLIDSTGAADLCEWNIEPKDTTDLLAVFGLAKWTSPSSPVSQSFKLQYSTESSGTVGIAEMCIVAVESHADDEYAGTDGEATTTSASYQDAQTLTFTPATQGDYLIIAYAELKPDTSANGINCQLDVDGSASHVANPAETSEITNYCPWMAVKKVNLTAASHTIKISYASNAGLTVRIRRRRILALRLDTLTANSSDYTSTRATTTSTTPVDAASTTFTAAGSVDYFAIGNVFLDGSSATISSNAQLSMDGAAANLGTREPTGTIYERAYAAINYSAFASGSRTVKTQVYSETASITTGYADRGVYVLDLREATGGSEFTAEPADAAEPTDAATLDVGGSYADSATTMDELTALVEQAMEDSAAAAEELTVEVEQALEDTSSADDDVTTELFEYQPPIELELADDAGTLDAVTSEFELALALDVELADEWASSVGTAVADATSASDDLAADAAVLLVDTVGSEDHRAADAELALADSTTPAELTTADISAEYADSASGEDEVVADLVTIRTLDLDDTAAQADAVTVGVEAAAEDTAAAVDTLVGAISVALADTAAPVDDFAGAIARGVADTAAASDTAQKAVLSVDITAHVDVCAGIVAYVGTDTVCAIIDIEDTCAAILAVVEDRSICALAELSTTSICAYAELDE